MSSTSELVTVPVMTALSSFASTGAITEVITGASFVPVRLMTILVVAVAPWSSVTVTGIVIVSSSPWARCW